MREIALTQGYVTLVDDEDYEELIKHKWLVDSGRYAARKAPHPLHEGKTYLSYMHREILGLQFGDSRKADHRDGNGLDNRRSNLRVATHSQNMWNTKTPRHNTSGLKGVSWDRVNEKWIAQIRVDKKPIWLGRHDSAEDAHRAYCAAALKYFGEFARVS